MSQNKKGSNTPAKDKVQGAKNNTKNVTAPVVNKDGNETSNESASAEGDQAGNVTAKSNIISSPNTPAAGAPEKKVRAIKELPKKTPGKRGGGGKTGAQHGKHLIVAICTYGKWASSDKHPSVAKEIANGSYRVRTAEEVVKLNETYGTNYTVENAPWAATAMDGSICTHIKSKDINKYVAGYDPSGKSHGGFVIAKDATAAAKVAENIRNFYAHPANVEFFPLYFRNPGDSTMTIFSEYVTVDSLKAAEASTENTTDQENEELIEETQEEDIEAVELEA